MPAAEERLTLLEVKMQEVGTTLVRIEGILAGMHQMIISLDQRVEKLDQRVDRLDQRMERLEQRVETLDQRSDKLDARVEKQFLWVAGIQMTTLITIMAGLFGLVAKLI
jgi:chromosome segregation ATPase